MLAVGCKRIHVVQELAGQVVAGLELVDLVRAVASRLGAGADGDLVGAARSAWPCRQLEVGFRLTPPRLPIIWRFLRGLAAEMAAKMKTARQKKFIFPVGWD